MSESSAEMVRTQIGREDRLLRLLAVACERLQGKLFFTASGETRARLPSGLECRLQDEEMKEWLASLGYEQSLVVRGADVKWMVRVLADQARQKADRVKDHPLSIIKTLQQEPVYPVLEKHMEGRDESAEFVGRLHLALISTAQSLGINVKTTRDGPSRMPC